MQEKLENGFQKVQASFITDRNGFESENCPKVNFQTTKFFFEMNLSKF